MDDAWLLISDIFHVVLRHRNGRSEKTKLYIQATQGHHKCGAAPLYGSLLDPMFLTHLTCGLCGKEHSKQELQTVCRDCGRPLLARYDLLAARAKIDPQVLDARRLGSLWRYREVLPLPPEIDPVTPDEGGTPLLQVPRLSGKLVYRPSG